VQLETHHRQDVMRVVIEVCLMCLTFYFQREKQPSNQTMPKCLKSTFQERGAPPHLKKEGPRKVLHLPNLKSTICPRCKWPSHYFTAFFSFSLWSTPFPPELVGKTSLFPSQASWIVDGQIQNYSGTNEWTACLQKVWNSVYSKT